MRKNAFATWRRLAGLAVLCATSPVLGASAGGSPRAPQAVRAIDGGVAIELRIEPDGSGTVEPSADGSGVVEPPAGGQPPGSAQNVARVRLRITDAASGLPIRDAAPGAWIERALAGAPASSGHGCSERIAGFLGRGFLARADANLNSYLALTLNDDASIGVLDPTSGFGGSHLLAMIPLAAPGEDWALSEDGERLLVTIPAAERVAVIDTVGWQVVAERAVPGHPSRVVIQSGEPAASRRAWVTWDGGVAALDGPGFDPGPRIATGAGPHDLALSADGRRLFVVNTGAGTVSVIDTRSARKLADIAVAGRPVTVAYSQAAALAFVICLGDGGIVAIDGESGKIAARLQAEPGIAAIRFARNGRYGFAVNPERDLLTIVDTASRKIVQTGKVERGPDQVVFSDTLAYVRQRGTDALFMVPLDEVGTPGAPIPLADVTGGRAAFGKGRLPSPADGIAKVPGENAVLVANPADRTVYYYREGMAAPMGELAAGGREPRAILVVDRSLREREPGVYDTAVRLPDGPLDVAVLVGQPRVVHCFHLEAAGQQSAEARPAPIVEALAGPGLVAGQAGEVRLRVLDAGTRAPKAGVADVELLVLQGGGNWSKRLAATPAGDGAYRVELLLPAPGVYFGYLESPTLGLGRGNHPSIVLSAGAAGSKGKRASGAPGQ